jgi:hypothetical protein
VLAQPSAELSPSAIWLESASLNDESSVHDDGPNTGAVTSVKAGPPAY